MPTRTSALPGQSSVVSESVVLYTMSPKLQRRLRRGLIAALLLALCVPLLWRIAPGFLIVDTGLPNLPGSGIEGPLGQPLTRPGATLSPSGGEGRVRGRSGGMEFQGEISPKNSRFEPPNRDLRKLLSDSDKQLSVRADGGVSPGEGNVVGAIIVLGGEAWTRPQRAAEVFREITGQRATFPSPEGAGVGSGGGTGAERGSLKTEILKRENSGPLMIVSGNGDCEGIRQMLEARGVPHAVIETECESSNTLENARFSVKLLREHRLTNAVIVTSWYHSRRALACFQQAAPEITFYSCPTAAPPGRSWWPGKHERARIMQEYAKIAYYWVVYGVWPFTN